MKNFILDPQLEKDCFVLAKSDNSLLLLLNNALFPWFILVPYTQATELYELETDKQRVLLEEINHISGFIKAELAASKLNVATIGNIVKQLHIHIIGRQDNDPCWPAVVWGTSESRAYTAEELSDIKKLSKSILSASFSFIE